MISVDEALTAILARCRLMPAVDTPILDALGQVVATDIRAPFDVPPLANAAMDGYALRTEDALGATDDHPARLLVIEDLPAGRCAVKQVETGTAIRIMTGAPLPEGADTVVQFEATGEGRGEPRAEFVNIYTPPDRGINIRQAGEDLRRGDIVLPRGTPLRPAQIGVLATMGFASAPVYRRPRVGILSTGDELLSPGAVWSPGKIYDANSYTLAGMAMLAGGIPVRLGVAPDRVEALVDLIRAADRLDLLVTSAGVSVGDYDVVKQALASLGEISFYQVRMRPGRPLAFGSLLGIPLIGLPGNPVASAISFELFGRPAILRMLGHAQLGRPSVRAVFQDRVDNRDARRSYYRVRLTRTGDEFVARLTGPQGSGILRSMALADGLMVIDEGTPSAGPGDIVTVQLLANPGDG